MAKNIKPTEINVMPMIMLFCMEANSRISIKNPALWYIFASFLHRYFKVYPRYLRALKY